MQPACPGVQRVAYSDSETQSPGFENIIVVHTLVLFIMANLEVSSVR